MKIPAKQQFDKVMQQANPEVQTFAESIAQTNIQNKMLSRQLAQMKSNYDELWKIMIVILDACATAKGDNEKELRIHESQFLRFKEEYRMDRFFDDETKEVVLKLLTIHDTPTISK